MQLKIYSLLLKFFSYIFLLIDNDYHLQYYENDYHLQYWRTVFRLKKTPISWLRIENRVKLSVHQINPKKYKEIKNKTIPNPLRPKFRQRAQTNIYFLSQRKVNTEKKNKIIKKTKLIIILLVMIIGGYLLSN